MSKTTKIQIPLDRTLRLQAEETAKDYGFSSLQEVVRVFLTGFAKKELQPSFIGQSIEVLTPKQDAKILTRLNEVYKAIEKGDSYKAISGKDVLKHARELR